MLDMALTIHSKIELVSGNNFTSNLSELMKGPRVIGYTMPLLGFGVYQNYTTRASVLEALRAGYR